MTYLWLSSLGPCFDFFFCLSYGYPRMYFFCSLIQWRILCYIPLFRLYFPLFRLYFPQSFCKNVSSNDPSILNWEYPLRINLWIPNHTTIFDKSSLFTILDFAWWTSYGVMFLSTPYFIKLLLTMQSSKESPKTSSFS